jgi:hypothetical protein
MQLFDKSMLIYSRRDFSEKELWMAYTEVFHIPKKTSPQIAVFVLPG